MDLKFYRVRNSSENITGILNKQYLTSTIDKEAALGSKVKKSVNNNEETDIPTQQVLPVLGRSNSSNVINLPSDLIGLRTSTSVLVSIGEGRRERMLLASICEIYNL